MDVRSASAAPSIVEIYSQRPHWQFRVDPIEMRALRTDRQPRRSGPDTFTGMFLDRGKCAKPGYRPASFRLDWLWRRAASDR